MKESDVMRDSTINGDRHIVRLTHRPTKQFIEVEGEIPRDRKREPAERKKTRDKAWVLLEKQVGKC